MSDIVDKFELLLNKQSIDVNGVKDVIKEIKVIDANVAARSETKEVNGKKLETVQDIADKVGNGKVIFTNEAALRAVSFKQIDLILLDGHNFSEGDLLQAFVEGGIGRVRRYRDKVPGD